MFRNLSMKVCDMHTISGTGYYTDINIPQCNALVMTTAKTDNGGTNAAWV